MGRGWAEPIYMEKHPKRVYFSCTKQHAFWNISHMYWVMEVNENFQNNRCSHYVYINITALSDILPQKLKVSSVIAFICI